MKTTVLTAALLFGSAGYAGADPASTWREFRTKHATHIQTLAVSQPARNGTRTLIIAEPPPNVTAAEIRERYGAILGDVAVRTHKVGFDGWTRDVTGTLVPMSDDELRATIQNISRDLFGTSYKAYALDLSSDQAADGGSYDLNATASELRGWLGLDAEVYAQPSRIQGSSSVVPVFLAWAVSAAAFAIFLRSRRPRYLLISVAAIAIGVTLRPAPATDREPVHEETASDASVQHFQALHGGDSATLRELFARRQRGVFVGTEPGLVVLLVSRKSPLNESAIALREFALESDLILGAVGDVETVAVLGRERQVSVDQLPPLRGETMIQLAAATTAELAQSYERRRFLAGKYDGLHDWAPILLSDELQDTEYGSLLNITDQLLKSWSQHGEIEYINFKYPKPPSYPFPGPLNKVVQAERITFNWNTKGVGYNDDRNGFDILAFTRTGSLPVDYLGESDSRLQTAEDTGYNYFASQNDPNLVRVVQYAGLYQIWRKFSVSGTYASSTRVRGGDQALAPLVKEAVLSVYDFDVDGLMNKLRNSADGQAFGESAKAWADLQESMDRFFDTYGADAVEDIVGYLVHPRSVRDPDSLDGRHRAAFVIAMAIQNSPLIEMFLDDYVPEAKKAYSEAEGREDAASWIKTPSIVVSWSTGKNAGETTGGHNLYSRVSHFTLDSSLPAGKVRVSTIGDEVTVFYSAEDAGKIGSSVRPLARRTGATISELEATVEQSLRAAIVEKRSMASALKLGARTNVEASVGSSGARVTRVAQTATWKSAGEIPQAHAAMLEQLKNGDLMPLVVERQQGKYLISRAGSNARIEAPDAASALDAIAADGAGAQPTHLHLIGMEPEQARSFAQAVEIHSGGPRASRLRTSVDLGEGRAPVVVGELRKGNWNWKTAELDLPKSLIGTTTKEIGFEIRVADTVGNRFKCGVRLVFDRVTQITAETMARVETVVRQWLVTLDAARERVDLFLATRRLMNDLKKIDPLLGHVEVRVADEAGEVMVVENEAPVEPVLGGE